jgi:hypothetical protein
MHYLYQLESSLDLLLLAMAAISRLRGGPALVEALIEAKRPLDDSETACTPEDERSLAHARREAALAESEVSTGFPLFHEQAIMSLWGWTENLFKAFVARLLEQVPGTFQVPEVSKLRVNLGEYQSLSTEERLLYVTDLLERELNAPLKQGINRFECLLEPFQLSGEVDPEVSRDLYELHHVRNLLAHRGGFVDRRFKQACPWINKELGERLSIDHAQYARYFLSVVKYVAEFKRRVRKRFGFHQTEESSSGSQKTENNDQSSATSGCT